MSWVIRIPGGTSVNSDDFTIEDLGEIEKATGESWAIANPLRSVAVAKGFLAAAMLRAGKSPAEVETALTLVRLKQLKNAFTYVDDEDGGEEEEVDPSGSSPSRTTGSSSPGSSTPESPPAPPDESGSGMS